MYFPRSYTCWVKGSKFIVSWQCSPQNRFRHAIVKSSMWWLRLVGSLKLQVSFAKKPYIRDDILPKRPIIWRSLLFVATPYSPVLYTYLPKRGALRAKCFTSKVSNPLVVGGGVLRKIDSAVSDWKLVSPCDEFLDLCGDWSVPDPWGVGRVLRKIVSAA